MSVAQSIRWWRGWRGADLGNIHLPLRAPLCRFIRDLNVVLIPGLEGKIVLCPHDSLYLPARSICALFVGLSLLFTVLGVIR
jgi:hypothetical protein